MKTPRRCLAARAGGLVVPAYLLLAGALQASNIPPQLLPIPESSADHTWYEAQRIRYRNTPLLRRAEVQFEDRDFAGAEDSLVRALANDPANTRARVLLLEAYFRLQEWDKAIALSDSLLRDHPQYHAVELYQAIAAHNGGDRERAKANFERALERELSPDQHRIAFRHLTRLAMEDNDFERAERLLERWLQQEDTTEVRALLVECATRRNDWNTADGHLTQLVDQTADRDDRGRLHLERGYLLANLERFEDAREAFLSAGDLLPGRQNRLDIARQLGELAIQSGNFRQAARNLKAFLLETFDEDVAMLYLLALNQSDQLELSVLEAREFVGRENVTEAFVEAAQKSLLQIHKELDNKDSVYQVARQLYGRFPRQEYLKETAAAADHLGRSEEAIQLYKAYLKENFEEDVALDYYELIKNRKPSEPPEQPEAAAP